LILFFFFQAEDGIRDFHVTGVQTCALPILLRICLNESTSDSGLSALKNSPRELIAACQRSYTLPLLVESLLPTFGQAVPLRRLVYPELPKVPLSSCQSRFGSTNEPVSPKPTVKLTMCCQVAGLFRGSQYWVLEFALGYLI